jgi:hypothetical protein
MAVQYLDALACKEFHRTSFLRDFLALSEAIRSAEVMTYRGISLKPHRSKNVKSHNALASYYK